MREYHYWIYCRPSAETDGKPVLIYGCPDHGSKGGEDNARSKALDMLANMDWELRRLPTRDMGTASALIRGKRLASGEGLRSSTQRIRHERGLSQWRQRRQDRGL